MPNKKSNSRKRDEDGKFISSKTTTTKPKETVETPVVENTNDVKTRHGSTIHFS